MARVGVIDPGDCPNSWSKSTDGVVTVIRDRCGRCTVGVSDGIWDPLLDCTAAHAVSRCES